MTATVTTPADLEPIAAALEALTERVTKLEAGTVTPIPPPVTSTESKNGTTITDPSGVIIDANGHHFTLVDSGAAGFGLQVAYDGVVDTNTYFVTLGLYSGHAFYQQNKVGSFYTGSPGNWTATSDPRAPAAPSVGGAAVRAYDVLDAQGVVCHFTNGDVAEWANWQACLNALAYLGLWNVRDGAAEFAPAQFKALIASGFKLLYGVCTNGGSSSALANSWNNGMNAVPGLIDHIRAVEWSNEVNGGGQKLFSASGASTEGNTPAAGAAYRACMGEFSGIMRPLVKNAKLAMSSLAFMGQDMTPYLQAIGDLRGIVDLGMCHDYLVPDDNGTVYDKINGSVASGGGAQTARAVMPDSPWACGECGYTNVIDDAGHYSSYMNVSQQAAKSLELEGFLSFFISSTPTSRMMCSYKYELMNQVGWSRTTVGNVSGEGDFGLFNSDYSPKPAATTIRNFATLLRDTAPTAQTFTPGKLAYTLSGDIPAKTKQLLVEFASGMFAVVVWSSDLIWRNNLDVAPSARKALLNLPAAARGVSYADPTVTASPGNLMSNVTAYPFTLMPWPVVLLVNP